MDISFAGAAPPVTSHAPYHRLNRLAPRTARWWRPIAAVAASAGLYVAGLVLGLVPLIVASVVAAIGGRPWAMSDDFADPTHPVELLISLGAIALMLPAVTLGMRWGGGARGTIHSVWGRVRWGFMARGAAIVLPLFAAAIGVPALVRPPDDFTWPAPGLSLVAVYVIILLLVPLQCAAEEYAFRGLPMQALGTWLRSPLWGVLLPVPLFMIGHGYDWVGQIDIAVFAICAGLLTWKSGGLELAIVMHGANNLILFLFAPFSPSSLTQGAVAPASVVFSVSLTLLTTVLLWGWVSRRYQLRTLEPVTRTTTEWAFLPSTEAVASKG